MRRRMAVVSMAGLLGCAGAAGSGSTGARDPLLAKIDSIISAPIASGKLAGASVAVVKGRDTIAVRAFGKADLQLGTPTPPRAVYEIGSVTKQFTGAAIMQLVEQGTVNLDADVTTYLPGLRLGGRKVPVRRLLDHTSGIKGYTEIPEARNLFLRKVPQDSIVGLFLSKPWDFEPGQEEIYNNSAFFLAGLIVEKVSGKPYGDYVKESLFDRAGMKDAHYCSETRIHQGKVQGYDSDSTGPVLKGHLSHAWPYAAGSLCSSAIDLVAWNEALHRDGKILGPEAYREFVNPGALADGTPLRYAKGIAVSEILGRRAYHHGGGINGFLSENIYFPDDSLSVVVLFNTAGPASPDEAARAIAAAVLGEPPASSAAWEGDPADYTGTYAGRGRGRPTELVISADGKILKVKGSAPRDTAEALTYVAGDTFGRQDARYLFQRTNGKVMGLRIDAVYGNNLLRRK